jgi:RND family efflux transporter MFP subunit
MARGLQILGAVVVGLVVVAAGAYGLRAWRSRASTVREAVPTPPSMPGMNHATTAAPAAVPRGGITIDSRRQQLIGVRLAPVTRESLRHSVRTVGGVRYDETSLADVNVRLEGWIRDLYVDYTGQAIQKGQPLFSFYSPDLLATAEEYLLALTTRERLQRASVAEVRERADQLARSARQRLVRWDLAEQEILAIEEHRQAPEVMTFRSPVSGVVIEKQALRGLHVMPGQTLYKVADLSVVWVEADLYVQDVALARVGQPATITLDAYPGETFRGRATYVDPFVEEATRTVKVRFRFENPRGRLKPGMYANVEIQGRDAPALTVPANAVLDTGTDRLVFVAQGEGYFLPRSVQIGRRIDGRIEIVEGLQEGEQVATAATFFLDSESQLRAGLESYAPGPAAAGGAAPGGQAVDLAVRLDPDPPRAGETLFEVAVKDPTGQPVSDATVTLQLFMPAMPTMNMPAMRSETTLPHAGGGIYRGPAQVLMSGRWEVTVVVRREGRDIGLKRFSTTAR